MKRARLLLLHLSQVTEHAQKIMHDLGITYQYAVPQSVYDRWDFWNCENVPDPLPDFLSERDTPPENYIGYGLSAEMAKAIQDHAATFDADRVQGEK